MKTLRKQNRLLALAMYVLVGILLGLVTGCGSGGGGSSVTIIPGAPTTLKAVLRPGQENHPVASTATAFSDLVISADNRTLGVNIVASNLNNVTLAHIHIGKVGTDGPPIFTLLSTPGAPQTLTALNKSLTEADLTPQPAKGINTFSDAINAIANGDCYVNIHTTANPAGELRGQVGPARIYAALNGLAVVPPVTTTAQGSVLLTFGKDMDTLAVNIEAINMTTITGASIRAGAVGSNGPVLFTVSSVPFINSLSMLLFPGDFTAGGGINSFSDALSAILSGNAYLEIRTTGQPTGEVRGQFTPFGYVADLTPGKQVPAVTGSTARGKLLITVSRDKSSITANLNTTGLTNTTMAHIHTGGPTVNGGVVFGLFDSATDGVFNGTITRTLTAANLTPSGSVNTFADFLAALDAGTIYGNVHTQANPSGLIRGQLVRQP